MFFYHSNKLFFFLKFEHLANINSSLNIHAKLIVQYNQKFGDVIHWWNSNVFESVILKYLFFTLHCSCPLEQRAVSFQVVLGMICWMSSEYVLCCYNWAVWVESPQENHNVNAFCINGALCGTSTVIDEFSWQRSPWGKCGWLLGHQLAISRLFLNLPRQYSLTAAFIPLR